MQAFERKTRVLALVLSCAALASPSEERPLAEAAPGEPLSVPELHFKIDVPSPEWAWAEQESGDAPRLFVCRSDEAEVQLMLMVFGGSWKTFNEQALRGFMSGTEKTSRELGFEVSDWSHGPVSIASRDGHRLRYRLTRSDGAVFHGYRYVLAAGNLYVLEALSVSDEEPAELRQVLATLEVAKPFREASEENPKEEADRELMLGIRLTIAYLFALYLCALVIRTVNAKTGSQWNGWKVGNLVVAVLAAIAAIYFWWNAPPSLSDYEWGHLFGAVVVGPTFWPLLLGWFFSRRFAKKRRNQLERRGGESRAGAENSEDGPR